MVKLLKVDFRRVLKDKLFMVVCIIAGVFALITPLMYVAIFGAMGGDFNDINEALSILGMGISAKSQFFASFSLGNNLGLVLPVLLAIILCKDFSQGTVRNKIIGGNSRSSIFLSMYTVCFCVLFGVLLLHAILTLLISLIFFPYQTTPVGASDIGYFFLSLMLEIILYVFVASLVSFLCVTMKNMGLAIVSYVAVIMIMSIVTSVLQLSVLLFEVNTGEQNKLILKILEFLQSINVFNFGSVIGNGVEYSASELLCCILSPLVGAFAFTSLGIYKFNRKDLK